MNNSSSHHQIIYYNYGDEIGVIYDGNLCVTLYPKYLK